MPTTRKRWQAETQESDTEINVKGQPARIATEGPSSTMPEPAINAQPDVVASSDEVNVTRSLPSIASTDSTTAPEERKRLSVQDNLDPRSPKRPRLSPIDDLDTGQTKPEHAASAPLSTTVSPQPQAFPALAAVSPTVPQPHHGPSHGVHALPQDGMPPTRTSSNSRTSTPSPQTRLDNLPILSHLAGQLLKVLAKMTPYEALNLASNVGAPIYQEYRTIRTLLDPVVNLYRTGPRFLIPAQLGLTSTAQAETIRKANQALWLTSIFTGEVGLRDMNLAFLFVFVPEGGKFLKSQGIILLELKTQAFITAHRVRAGDPRAVLADLFTDDMDQQILSRRPGTQGLAPSEQEFLKRFSSRRNILADDIRVNRLEGLQDKYRWADLSKEVCGYISKNYGTGGPSGSSAAQDSASNASYDFSEAGQAPMQRAFSVNDPPMTTPGTQTSMPLEYPQRPLHSYPRLIPNNKDDWMTQLARASEVALKDPTTQSGPTAPPAAVSAPRPQEAFGKTATPVAVLQQEFQHYDPSSANTSSKNNSLASGDSEIPHASQTAPTQVLYQRARQAATDKAIAKAAPKPDSPSQRRPWTDEEESALMTGLDQVKGPHWSQILAMYGRGGSINESLKDRNQVQLKDKARNLKLFFLKNGTEVPYYLTEVTGDLKTRAPGQAERQERERLQTEENKAHYDGLRGIMALANGELYDPDEVEEVYDEEDMADGDEAEKVKDDALEQPPVDMADVEAMIARASERPGDGQPSEG